MKAAIHLFIFAGSLFFALSLKAQSCTPYVIYKDDFGGDATAPGMGKALDPGITTYKYETTTPVEDGGYGIRKQVKGHGGTNGAWHQITDHGGSGYMMLINASYDPGLFYQKTITNLCQGTSFYFSAWVANLMKPTAGGDRDPDLKFIILNPDTREIIGTYTTGLLPRYANPTWEEYGIHFDLPSGVSSVVLQIFNNAEGGNGNDLVLDDITFSICGPPLHTYVTGMYQNGLNICSGKQVDLRAELPNGGFNDPAFQWQFGSDTTGWQDIAGAVGMNYTISNTATADSGWYRIVVAEKGNIDLPYCRIASNALPVHVWQPRTPDILTNSPICEGQTLSLKVPAALQLSCQWTGPDGFTSDQQSIIFANAGTELSGLYQLNAINPGGCIISNQKQITVQQNRLSINLNKTDSILCEGSLRRLNATNPGATYLWNTGAISPEIVVDTAGFYKVAVQQGVCTISDSIQLYPLKVPKVSLGADTSVCNGEPFFLHATYTDVRDYQWNNGASDSVFVVTQPGTYIVTLSNYCGVASDRIHIDMEPCSDELIFPTAFTPNQDGQNDLFRPRVLFRLSDYKLKIYDRWGKLIFQSVEPSGGWNGTLNGKTSPTGAYIWTAQYKRIKDDKNISQKGVITLIR